MDTFSKPTDSQLLRSRLLILSIGACLLFGVLLARLYYLQVIEHEQHQKVADQNRIDIRPIKPKRGLVFDRNGVLIADNQPSFSLELVPEDVRSMKETKRRLSAKIGLSPRQLTIFDKAKTIPRRPYEPIVLKDRLTSEEIASIVVDLHTLPGLSIDADLRRRYPFGAASAHILGFVGRISEKERQSSTKIRPGISHTGKKGIELTYEDTLSGIPGHRFIETNARGRFIKTLETHPPKAGIDLKLTVNMQLQQAIFNRLSEFKRAAAVAIEPGTGEILAMVSLPSYDPNEFVSGLSHDEYQTLRDDYRRPLFNRAVQGQYPPGSTIKMMVGLAALDLGLTNWQKEIWDPGYYQLPNQPARYRDWKRWGHGQVNLDRAIVESCDTYFYDIGERIAIDDLHEYMLGFGLGAATGIDLIGEAGGLFPSSRWKRRHFKQPWFPGETLIATIGQGYVLATPLQLAHATAVLANRGFSASPHLVGHTRPHSDNQTWTHYNTTPEALTGTGTRLHFSDPNWQKMIDAMVQVVAGKKGTARGINRNLNYSIAGKTGTAQVVGIAQDATYDPELLAEEHLDHALFVGFAPANAPQIALAVIIENGGSGGAVAAPVARDILDAFFKDKILQASVVN